MDAGRIDYDTIAEIYDLYVTDDYDIPFFLEESARAGGRVLELTAGTGRLSLPLVQAGVPMVCVDASLKMLQVLSGKLKTRGLRVEIVCADVCRLVFHARFRLALFPFQSFMEIIGETCQRQALSAVCESLVAGGRFVCTLHNPAVRKLQVDGTCRVTGRFPVPDGSLVVSGLESGGHPVVSRMQFFECYGTNGTLLWKRMLPMEFEFIERDRFEAMACDAGFRVLHLYGNYDRSSFEPDCSPVMIWVLEKPDSHDSDKK